MDRPSLALTDDPALEGDGVDQGRDGLGRQWAGRAGNKSAHIYLGFSPCPLFILYILLFMYIALQIEISARTSLTTDAHSP